MSKLPRKDKVWSSWYVLHNSGTGTRLLYRYPDIKAGAGNTSAMIYLNKWEFEFKNIKKVRCIRIRIQSPAYTKNKTMLSKMWVLDDYLEQKELDKIDPEQGSLEGW